MEAIKRISVTDEAVKIIKQLIESGEYAIGDKLPTEISMCESMAVSRTCVREAIRVLQALGFVEVRPGKGAFVADYTIRETENWYNVSGAQFYDFMEVRMAIETLSTRLAVTRANDNDILKLDEIHQSFLSATQNKNLTQLIMLDELFHTEIIKITKNKLLLNINEQLVKANKKYRGESFTNDKVYKNAIEPHSRILKCFHDKDHEKGQIEMFNHLELTKRDIESLVNEKK